MFKYFYENVTIGTFSKIKQVFDNQIKDLVNNYEADLEKTNNLDVAKFIKEIKEKSKNYPKHEQLIKALDNLDVHQIEKELLNFRSWINNLNYRDSIELRELTRNTWNFIDKISKRKAETSQEYRLSVQREVNAILLNSYKNAQKLHKIIQAFLDSSKESFEGTIVVKPILDKNSGIDIITSFEVTLGREEYSPSFTVFIEDDKFKVDDILDGGDIDFFRDNKTQKHYFELIDWILGKKTGKSIILYTARPKKDRDYLLNSKSFPTNIFLCNDLNHVEGLAADFTDRDIWKVKINTKYLIQTLDGKVKYYQLVYDDAPVEKFLL